MTLHLKNYQNGATKNIIEAKKIISIRGNNQILKANIKSNNFTIKVIKFYTNIVINQKNKVKNN